MRIYAFSSYHWHAVWAKAETLNLHDCDFDLRVLDLLHCNVLVPDTCVHMENFLAMFVSTQAFSVHS